MTGPSIVDPIVTGEWRKNRDEIVRVQLSRFMERDNLDVRVWFTPEDGAAPRPGRAGISVSVRHLPAMAYAVTRALEIARDMGLVPPHGEEGEGR